MGEKKIQIIINAVCIILFVSLVLAGIWWQGRQDRWRELNIQSFLSEPEEAYCDRYCVGHEGRANSFIGYFDYENSEYVDTEIKEDKFTNITYKLRLVYNEGEIDIWLFLDSKSRIDRFLNFITPFEMDGKQGITTPDLISICAYVDDEGFYIGSLPSLKIADIGIE